MFESKSLFKSQEKKQNNRKIMYPFNSYTSIFYFIIMLPLLKTNIDNFDIIGLTIAMSLSISSVLWWGYKNKYIQIIDISSYSLLIFYIGFYYLRENKYILDIFVYLTFIIVFITIKKRQQIKYLNVLGGSFSFIVILYYIKSIDEILGLSLLFLSLFCKMTDSLDIIDYNKLKVGAGTGWFHMLSALGIYFIINHLNI